MEQKSHPIDSKKMEELAKYENMVPRILMYREAGGGRVLAFGGLLTGMLAAREGEPGWYRGFVLAEKMGIPIEPDFGYEGLLVV